MRTTRTPFHVRFGDDAGFTLAELLVSSTILLVVFGVVTTSLSQLAQAHRRIWNRTEMHSGARGATELLQQEVGQAGRVALPGPVTLTQAAMTGTVTVAVSSAAGMFVGEQLVVYGDAIETITLAGVNTTGNTITTTFFTAHPNGAAIIVAGGFSSGVVPPSMTNGSTGSVLKLYGDINSDGNMVYVEYSCDYTAQNLYRNVMPFNAATKPAKTPAMVLLTNVIANPGGTPCFTYQTETVGTTTYVTDVAITLTVRTQQVDPTTKQYQTEAKALLNVSPRNVFHVWELASLNLTKRIQPIPPSVVNLLQ